MLGGIQATFLYGAEVFTTKPGFTFSITHNDAPTIKVMYPENESIGIQFKPLLQIYGNDTDTAKLNITWQQNTSGSWITMQVNNSFTQGTLCECNYTLANTGATTYYWRAYVDDGTTNVSSGIYHFTTRVS